MPAHVPRPVELQHLRPSTLAGAGWLATASAITAAGIWLSSHRSFPAWLGGELLLAGALVQWFVLMHECGHGTLLRHTWLNVIVGHTAGFFSLVPFAVWRRVHDRHHKWTGWQDIDPTT